MMPLPQSSASPTLEDVRQQFPILSRQFHGRRLAYLDSAASAQQPDAVIAAVADYHQHHHANIHRGVYALSQEATGLYDQARARVAGFINAAEPAECLFTTGTTGAINLVAASWGLANLNPGDEILLTELEHHSNIVPWQLVAARTGALIKVVPIDDSGELDLDTFTRLLSARTRMVAITQLSNALGTINPVAKMIQTAHAAGALVLIDGAQWVAHGATDVQALDADFYAFSGHKLYGPTGIGVLYGKRHLLEAMPPWQGGGDMIEHVSFAGSTYAPLPARFEAGTQNMAGAIGLAAAIDWLDGLGMDAVSAHEQALYRHLQASLAAIPGLAIQGAVQNHAGQRAAALSWIMTDPPIATLDVGTRLDLHGVSIRTGHHCCQPLMARLGIAGTARASLGVYSSRKDIDQLATALEEIVAQERSRQRVAVTDKTDGEYEKKTPFKDSTPPQIDYPPAAANSPQAAAEEIADLFSLLPDWPMRHQHIIELGERLAPLPEAFKTAATEVHGCQSTVHLVARRRPDTEDNIEFLADSDAQIVRGLIALLVQLYSGQRAAAILAFDVDAFFAEIGLDAHLSMSRRNGLAAMIGRLRQVAKQYTG